ncbi:MAG TPA: dimethylsulfonioproprionate lyase family protein, partial [Solirubrobacteraceae bacterium]
MGDPAPVLRELLADLAAALRRGASTSTDPVAAVDLAEFARLTRSVDVAVSSLGAPPSATLPVVRFWHAALDAAEREPTASLCGALRALEPRLTWTQNPNYRRHPPDPGFLDDYGYAVLAGPPDGPPPLALDRHLALGVLLLGRGTHYPLHHHPAIEVYVTASGNTE